MGTHPPPFGSLDDAAVRERAEFFVRELYRTAQIDATVARCCTASIPEPACLSTGADCAKSGADDCGAWNTWYMSDQRDQGQDPVDVEPTDNSAAAPVDLNQVEEVEKEMREPER